MVDGAGYYTKEMSIAFRAFDFDSRIVFFYRRYLKNNLLM